MTEGPFVDAHKKKSRAIDQLKLRKKINNKEPFYGDLVVNFTHVLYFCFSEYLQSDDVTMLIVKFVDNGDALLFKSDFCWFFASKITYILLNISKCTLKVF